MSIGGRSGGQETWARVEALQRKLTTEMERIQSGEDWRRMLDVASRLHRYSAGNLILIALQHAEAYRAGRVSTPTPSYVAGFHSWQALGRSVDHGQRGYAILAPVPRQLRIAVSGTGPGAVRRVLARDEGPRPGERLEVEPRLAFKIAHVFDVSATSGRPLPNLPRPRPLTGRAPDGLIDELTRFATERGFTVVYAADGHAPPGADAVTHFDMKTITMRAGMSEASLAVTLAHEVGHVLLHDPERDRADASVHRGVGEVEAESVAYIVLAAHGVDSSGESLPYVATWAGGRTPSEVVQRTAQRVVSAAHELLTALETVQHSDGAPPGLDVALQGRAHRGGPEVEAPAGPALAVGV